MFDHGHHARGHEASRSNHLSGTCHLGYLNGAAHVRYFDAPAGAGSFDLVRLGPAAYVDDDLDAITSHT